MGKHRREDSRKRTEGEREDEKVERGEKGELGQAKEEKTNFTISLHKELTEGLFP
jgi:hypothetical protein